MDGMSHSTGGLMLWKKISIQSWSRFRFRWDDPEWRCWPFWAQLSFLAFRGLLRPISIWWSIALETLSPSIAATFLSISSKSLSSWISRWLGWLRGSLFLSNKRQAKPYKTIRNGQTENWSMMKMILRPLGLRLNCSAKASQTPPIAPSCLWKPFVSFTRRFKMTFLDAG